MKANTIIALKKIIKETVEKEVARQLKVVIEEIVNPTPTNNSQVMVEDNLPSYTTERMGEIAGGAPMQPTGDMPDFMKKAMSGHSAKVVKAIENKHGTKS